MPQSVASRRHSIVETCRALGRGRGDAGLVLLDGEHLVRDAIRAKVPLDALVVERGRFGDLAGRVEAAGVTVYEATAAVIEAVSPVRTPTGIVAIARWTPVDIARVFASVPALTLGLVDVQDPGNAGAAIRSADALGATGVIAVDATADPAGWKSLRGAMGSTFRVPVARASLVDAIAAARSAGVCIMATVARDGVALDRAPLASPALVLVGNEGAGLSLETTARADLLLTIPMRPGIDSLNVAVTAALILAEARRQRSGSSPS